MEPNKFRESRRAINKLCKNIDKLIEQKAVDASKVCYENVMTQWDALSPQAEGEIQKRSVKNLGIKINGLSTRIGKLKPPKRPASKRGPKIGIVWNDERVGQLAKPFLEKLFAHMGDDTGAKVSFGTTGKGIRPNYQIEYSTKETIIFTGSGHKPLDKPLSAAASKRSQPFSQETIHSILEKK